jgi:hypothetical protein
MTRETTIWLSAAGGMALGLLMPFLPAMLARFSPELRYKLYTSSHQSAIIRYDSIKSCVADGWPVHDCQPMFCGAIGGKVNAN